MPFLSVLAEEAGLIHVPIGWIATIGGTMALAIGWLATMGLRAIKEERAALVAAHAAEIKRLMEMRTQEQERTLRLLGLVKTLHPETGGA